MPAHARSQKMLAGRIRTQKNRPDVSPLPVLAYEYASC
jgi:hypothetical protein